MSDNTVEVVVPEKIVLTHEGSAFTEAEQRKNSEMLTKAKAVMYLDKIYQEGIIKELEPKIKILRTQIAAAETKLRTVVQQFIAAIDTKSAFAKVREALRVLSITGVKCTVQLDGVDIAAGHFDCLFQLCSEASKHNYKDYIEGRSRKRFTPVMRALRKEYLAQQRELADMETRIVAAHSALRDRANRSVDVEGAMALKSLCATDKQDVKDLYRQLSTGLSATKLLES